MIEFALSMIMLWASGIAAAVIIFRKKIREFSMTEFFALSFFIGLGVISYQLFIFYLLNIGFQFYDVILVPSAATGFLVFYLIIQTKNGYVFTPSLSRAGKWGGVEKALLAGILLQIAWVLYLTLPSPVNSYDALANYALKAKAFYLNGGIPEGFFGWGEAAISHPDYPLLLPLSMVWVYQFTGFNDVAVVCIMPVIYVFFLVLFYSQLKRFIGSRYALFCAFFIATIPQITNYVSIIHADFVLLAFVTAAFLYFMLYMRLRDRGHLVAASILFAFSLWVKNEAAVFCFAFLACFMAFLLRADQSLRKSILKDMLISLGIIAFIAGPWLGLKFLKHAVNSDINYCLLTSERLLENIKGFPQVLNEFQKQVFGPKKWNIFWVVIFAVMIIKHKKLFKGEMFYITLFLSIAAAGYMAAYLSTTTGTIQYVVNKTMSRFMIHFAGVSLFLAALLWHDEKPELGRAS